jgi:ribonuclease-3
MQEELPQPEENAAPTPSEEMPPAPDSSFEQKLGQLQELIGYQFQELEFLRRALTHRSFANEQPEPRPLHNEALEFLGDAVLEFLVSAWLLELYPTQKEGVLSKLRAFAVSAANLQTHAVRLRLGDYLLLNKGEEKTGGRSKSHLQVDAYEALLAAIYLDGGIEAARAFVKREFAATFAEMNPQDLTATDYKTALQESLQANGLPTPKYAVIEKRGPDHRRIFQVELRVNGKRLSTGQGTTIKSAHQDAARAALTCLPEEVENLKTAE